MFHEKRVEIRWSDVDAYMHVNNAVYATYFEECRDEWVERTLGAAGDAWISFSRGRHRLPARAPARGRGGRRFVSLERIGNSSLTLREQIRTRDGELAAEARSLARDRRSAVAPLSGRREAFERAL